MGSFASHLLGFQTRKKARDGGDDIGTITNAREPSPGIPVHSKSLRAALQSRAIVSAAWYGEALGATFAGGGRQRHLKGTTWASDQIARL